MNLSESKFFKHFKNIQIGATGVGVGVAGLGNLYQALIKDNGVDIRYASILQYIFTTFTIIFLVLILLRNIAHKNTFKNELKHPLLSSFLPTMCMCGMLISGFIAGIGDIIYKSNGSQITNDVLTGIGSILWYISVIAHICVFSLFFCNIVLKHKIKSDNLYASWFVPPVGIIVACTVSGSFHCSINFIPNEMFQAVWYFGFALYSITLPIVSYKLIFHRAEDKNTLPSIAIYGAPANLSLVGFISVFTDINANYYSVTFINTIVIMLTFLGLLTTLVVYVLLVRILSIKFNPAFASLTFPLAIGATGMYKSSSYLQSKINDNLYLSDLFWIIRVIAYIELAIASIVIMYVLSRYIYLISKKLFFNKNVSL